MYGRSQQTLNSSSPYINLWILCMNSHYSQLGFLVCGHVVCESKSLCLLASLPLAHTLYQQVCKWRLDGCLLPPQPLWSMGHVALAHFSLLTSLMLLSVRLLMFSDTSSCHTGTNLSPLAAAPTASSTKPCCISCSRFRSHCLWAFIKIFSTHSSSQACTAFLLPGWKYIGSAVYCKLVLCSVEVLEIGFDC